MAAMVSQVTLLYKSIFVHPDQVHIAGRHGRRSGWLPLNVQIYTGRYPGYSQASRYRSGWMNMDLVVMIDSK